jgi:hypothetical protein
VAVSGQRTIPWADRILGLDSADPESLGPTYQDLSEGSPWIGSRLLAASTSEPEGTYIPDHQHQCMVQGAQQVEALFVMNNKGRLVVYRTMTREGGIIERHSSTVITV